MFKQNALPMSSIEFVNKFNQTTSLLNAFAYNLTKNVDDARDLFQETAYRAIKNQEKFRPGTNFKAWLMTIMKNIFINDYRKKVKRNTFSDSTDNNFFLNSGARTEVNSGEANMLIDELSAMIDDLQEGFKVPFMLHYKGYKYHEISDHMNLPLGTVKSRIFFARKELKKKIAVRYPNMDTLLA